MFRLYGSKGPTRYSDGTWIVKSPMRWRRHPVVSMDAGWQALSTQAWSGAEASALVTLLALPGLPPPPLAQPPMTPMIATRDVTRRSAFAHGIAIVRA